MSVVPPLVLLAAPVVPMLRGCRGGLCLCCRPLLRAHGCGAHSFFIEALPAWLMMNLTFLAWHVPAAYDFALENELGTTSSTCAFCSRRCSSGIA